MENKLVFADNLDYLKRLTREHPKGFIDLVYIDPPFNSQRDYNVLFEEIDMTGAKAQKQVFEDTWSNISYIDAKNEIIDLNLEAFQYLDFLEKIRVPRGHVSYLTTIAIRVIYIHKSIRDGGTFYFHCDPTMSHYVKILLDIIFRHRNFRNEIIWCYRGAGYPRKDFGRRHDVIFRYTKGDKYVFNLDDVRVPYAEATQKRFSGYIGNVRGGKDYGQQSLNPLGRHPDDWWPLQPIAPSAKARLGYPTQKPEELLEKIVLASSNEGDLVADFFCGCGTTIAVAERLNRKWLGVDISHLAINLVAKRLRSTFGTKVLAGVEIDGLPKDIASAKELAQNTVKGRFKFQDWVVEILLGGVSNPKKVSDGNIDGYKTFSVDIHGATKTKKEVVYIEVKSGKTTITDVRSICSLAKTKKSITVLVCFEEYITTGMQKEAKLAGKYVYPNGMVSNFDLVQVVSVNSLLLGSAIQMPVSSIDTFRTSEYFPKEMAEQLELD